MLLSGKEQGDGEYQTGGRWNAGEGENVVGTGDPVLQRKGNPVWASKVKVEILFHGGWLWSNLPAPLP